MVLGWAVGGDFSLIEEGTAGNRIYVKRGTGYVGIGTTSPQYKLDVNGSIHAGNGIFFPDGTFLGTGAVGTITGVLPGAGLSGGGYSGNVSLGVDNTVARTNVTQSFSGNQYFNSGIQVAGGAYLFNNFATNIIEAVCPFGYCLVFSKTHGDLHISGTLFQNGQDFAESVQVSGNRSDYGPGDVIAIDPTAGPRTFTKSTEPYSRLVAGIYSTQPGTVSSRYPMDTDKLLQDVPLAVVGIAPCKVTDENGPISPGDLLVTSSTPGYAMKGTDPARMTGAIVGKALQALPKGTGAIPVLVSLQ